MALINPKQVEHLRIMQPEFKFKERSIQPSLEVVSTNELLTNISDEVELNYLKTDDTNKAVDIKKAADNNKVKKASDDNLTKLLSLSNIPEESTITQKSAADSIDGSVSHAVTHQQAISKEDKLLLLRVRWLIDRLVVPNLGYQSADLHSIEGCVTRSK
jgi:hypothetical protein